MHSAHTQGQELMTDWTPMQSNFGSGIRREKESSTLSDGRAIPSPSYSHLSPGESSTPSAYTHSQPSTFHMPYSTMPASHLHPMTVPPGSRLSPLGQGPTFYPTSAPNGEYDVFTVPPTHLSGQVSPSPYAESTASFAQAPTDFDGTTPLLTTTTLSRTYDTTIPSYYQTTSDGRATWTPVPEKQASTTKRKKERNASKDGTPVKALKTPKRTKQQQQEQAGSSGSSGRRAAKRVKVDLAATAQTQLPTPPSSSKETTMSALPIPPVHSAAEPLRPAEQRPRSAGEAGRRGLVITRHQDEGRKLGLHGASQGELEEPRSSEETQLSPRTTTIPALTTDETGLATLATDEVLQSEVAWFESRTQGTARSPPSSPDMISLRTPPASHEAILPEEDTESPLAVARRVRRRMKAFSEHAVPDEQPLVSTRIEMFGRVAVRMDTAIKFLGLEPSARLIEETKTEDEEDWMQRPMTASSSKTLLRPLWPDDEAPWALAGGSRKERMRREESEKAMLLRRYLESTSDDSSSDEEGVMAMYTTHGKGKGKSVSRLVSISTSNAAPDPTRKRRNIARNGVDADARSALMISLRHRVIPALPAGVVACACGGSGTAGMGSMISCAACKTWHHIMCCGIEDESTIGPNWWCATCTTNSRSMRTPAHTTPRGRYGQLADPRSSAVKSDIGHIALAPSPMFVSAASISAGMGNTRTPLSRVVSSPKRPERARMLSYGSNDMWAFTEDGAPPSTPAPIVGDRYSTPRIDDAPFDVTSTPSRHLDFNFGQPSLFSLTPLGGRSRMPTAMLIDGTPVRGIPRNVSGPGGPLEPMTMSVPSRADFFRELNKSTTASGGIGGLRDENAPPVSPRWPHGLLGAHNLSPSPFGHKRSLSGNKMSSMRSSSRSGILAPGLMGLGVAEEKEEEE
ncbi:hypothetical protein IAU60_000438 [Kwoniella sp. DSM 27419]